MDPEEWLAPTPALKARDEPESLRKGVFVEDRLHRLVKKAILEKFISVARAARILRISIDEMMDLADFWRQWSVADNGGS